MAFTNKRGENISFECSELIDELKSDIEEFGGDKIVAARCKDTHGVTLYVNTDHDDDSVAYAVGTTRQIILKAIGSVAALPIFKFYEKGKQTLLLLIKYIAI